MTICDLTNAYTPTSGGIRTYLHEKRRFLLRHTGHRHVMIVPGARDETIAEGRAVTHVVHGPLVPGCAPYRAMLRLDKVFRLLRRENPDIVELATGYVLPLVAFGYRKARGAPVVGFCHTDYPGAYVQPFLGRHAPRLNAWGTGLARRHFRYVYRQCDMVLAASNAMTETLREAGVTDVERVALGVDASLFHPRKRDPALRRELGVDADGVLLAYVGRMDAEKRVAILLEAFALAMTRFNGTLVIMGDGPLRGRTEAFAATTNRVVVLPYQTDRHQLARLLASADIYATAGPHETFALSVVEAQASGLPVVGVRAGALVERVPEEVGLLGPVDSPAAMAENIIALSSNGMRTKGAAARRMVEDTLSWDRSFERLVGLYGRLGAR